ncbi:MAG: zinc dependent phospholipase C family protein [Bacteroidia bacterium]
MKKLSLTLLILLIVNPLLFSWGFYGHRIINRMAVFALPPEMFGFYKFHIDYLTEHAVDPDKRRYSDKEEAPRHYIDLDHFEKAIPIDTMPFDFEDAQKKFTLDTLLAYGIVPWHIVKVYNQLKYAFKEKNSQRILKLSADIGHYIADAHVPLHTSENYNGQLTNQHGIHGFLESRLVELFAKDYDFFVGKANYVNNMQAFGWKAVEGSFAALDSVFLFERKAAESIPERERFSYEQKGQNQIKVYSVKYANAYHNMLNGMVERRMQAAILAVACIWYSAWVDAGQPNLNDLLDKKPEKAPKQKELEEMIGLETKEIENLKMIGRQE